MQVIALSLFIVLLSFDKLNAGELRRDDKVNIDLFVWICFIYIWVHLKHLKVAKKFLINNQNLVEILITLNK